MVSIDERSGEINDENNNQNLKSHYYEIEQIYEEGRDKNYKRTGEVPDFIKESYSLNPDSSNGIWVQLKDNNGDNLNPTLIEYLDCKSKLIELADEYYYLKQFYDIHKKNYEKLEIIIKEKDLSLPRVLKEAKMVPSTSEALRLIKQGAVKVEGKKIVDPKYKLSSNSCFLYQVGKRKFFRINIPK